MLHNTEALDQQASYAFDFSLMLKKMAALGPSKRLIKPEKREAFLREDGHFQNFSIIFSIYLIE